MYLNIMKLLRKRGKSNDVNVMVYEKDTNNEYDASSNSNSFNGIKLTCIPSTFQISKCIFSLTESKA